MKIAVIGSGISGLSAAYFLSREHDVHVFERDARLGGHTHTVVLADGTAVDTGFIVHNRVNYPRFVRLMDELGVPTGPSDMSFAYHGPELSWCSRGLNGILTERSQVFRPRFWKLWRDVARFNALGRRLALDGLPVDVSLQTLLDQEGLGDDFRQAYLLPMAGAVWSTTTQDMLAFPALTLLRFFLNHGMLGFTSQHPWRTIPGGTRQYLAPLTRPFREQIYLNEGPVSVERAPDHVRIRLAHHDPMRFDQVVFACHGNQVLPLLADATPLERDILGAFQSNHNPTWLHTDTSILPTRRRAWASWNFRRSEADRLRLTYHMNRLQPLNTQQDLLVTLHGEGLVDEAKTLLKLDYDHPRFDAAAIRAQRRWSEISGHQRTHFAGAYWGYGFHEDGLNSGLRVAEALGLRW